MPRTKWNDIATRGVISERDMPEGTKEELRATWERAEKYIYKVLSYAPRERDRDLTKEEIEEERRYMKFIRLGPRAGYLSLSSALSLTSADVLYILTSCIPSTQLGAMYGVDPNTINRIRANKCKEWAWEFYFIKRLRTFMKAELLQSAKDGYTSGYVMIYKLEHLQKDNTLKVLEYISGIRKAKKMRQDLCPKREFITRTYDGTLDIVWPITKIHLA